MKAAELSGLGVPPNGAGKGKGYDSAELFVDGSVDGRPRSVALVSPGNDERRRLRLPRNVPTCAGRGVMVGRGDGEGTVESD